MFNGHLFSLQTQHSSHHPVALFTVRLVERFHSFHILTQHLFHDYIQIRRRCFLVVIEVLDFISVLYRKPSRKVWDSNLCLWPAGFAHILSAKVACELVTFCQLASETCSLGFSSSEKANFTAKNQACTSRPLSPLFEVFERCFLAAAYMIVPRASVILHSILHPFLQARDEIVALF